MPDIQLPPNHDVGPIVLHADGSLTLSSGMKVVNQAVANHRFDDGVLETFTQAGSMCVRLRFNGGWERLFEYRAGSWHEVLGSAAFSAKPAPAVATEWWKRPVVLGAAALGVFLILLGLPTRKAHERVSGELAAGTTAYSAADDARSSTENRTGKTTPSTREPNPAEVLANQGLTCEQKRSQFYSLVDAAGSVFDRARHQTNYLRTESRLSRYPVDFTPSTEHEFVDLIERVDSYLSQVDHYRKIVEESEKAVLTLEKELYERVRYGDLDPEARTLFGEITSSAGIIIIPSIGGSFGKDHVGRDKDGKDRYEYSVTCRSKARLVRWQVTAADLFSELAAIRSCQYANGVLKARQRTVGMFYSRLSAERSTPAPSARANSRPADKKGMKSLMQVATEAGEKETGRLEKERKRLEQRLRENPSDPTAQREHELIDTITENDRKQAEQYRHPAQHQDSTSASRVFADRLEIEMAADAGILESALKDVLLDYPWPWPVPTTPAKAKLFTLTSRPVQ